MWIQKSFGVWFNFRSQSGERWEEHHVHKPLTIPNLDTYWSKTTLVLYCRNSMLAYTFCASLLVKRSVLFQRSDLPSDPASRNTHPPSILELILCFYWSLLKHVRSCLKLYWPRTNPLATPLFIAKSRLKSDWAGRKRPAQGDKVYWFSNFFKWHLQT